MSLPACGGKASIERGIQSESEDHRRACGSSNHPKANHLARQSVLEKLLTVRLPAKIHGGIAHHSAERKIHNQMSRSAKDTIIVAEKTRAQRKGVPEGLWNKCPACNHVVYSKALKENLSVCPRCQHHFVMGARERIQLLTDEGTFEELFENLETQDPLAFRGTKSYLEKLKTDQKKTGLEEAAVVGTAECLKRRAALGVTDSNFIMGSMASVVGEKITRLIELAIEEKLPLVIVSGSGGGARMYEGMYSLMQMAKTSAALARFAKTRMPYISVLTHPTMGGVMASFASLGDFILAEPRALIGFAGPRVIEQTIRQKLPPDFQTSEFLLEHGLIDCVVPRAQLKETIVQLIDYCL